MTIEIIRTPKARVFHHIERGKMHFLQGRKYRTTDRTSRVRLIPGRSFCSRSKSANRGQAEYLSYAELAVYASVCVNTLKKWVTRGMPVYQVGGVLRVKRTEFDAWMLRFRNGTESADQSSVWAQVMEEV
jgi:excisionase family DNA binding protein